MSVKGASQTFLFHGPKFLETALFTEYQLRGFQE